MQADRHDVRVDDSVRAQLSFLSEIIGCLPAGVTVQDEQGNFIFVNDAAAAQFNTLASDIVETASDTAFRSRELNDRRHLVADVLQSGRSRTIEEFIRTELAAKVYLTTHKPLQISNRRLLLSSSVDLSQQKAVEEELFRCAYYDELTGLPTRRVIERRANSLIRVDGSSARFALA
ncbi:MAG: diguanylate cyclase, partial [Proteobacteria bacterium]|nr:diguanylate cyclase [Pseudomonadota bacterium]